MKRTITPTPEQERIRHHARTAPDQGRLVEAGAGSGKTSTLELLAQDRRSPCVYLAFNKAIQQEASQRFPKHVKCLTAHGAAYRATNMRESNMQARLTGGRIYPDQVGKLVRLPRSRLPEDALGHVVIETVAAFCNSADPVLSDSHVALDPLEPPDLREAALAGARALWKRMYDRNDSVPITHDTYLKAWQLGDARLPDIEWALFDEAQDASPVMIDVMMRQGIPVTWVGDAHQAIYAFRGAVNAMRSMAGARFELTQSFRFGSSIADMANDVLAAKPAALKPNWRLTGNPARQSQIAQINQMERHAFLSRTNVEWVAEALRHPASIHVIGGIDEAVKLLEGAYGLWRNRIRARSIPSLSRFTSWNELCEFAEKFTDRELTFARRLVEQYQDRLPGALASLRSRHVEHEDDAMLILSTAHKAKGREFDKVRLGEGFVGPGDPSWAEMSDSLREAELNLLYVALTRAKETLHPCRAALACAAQAKGLDPILGAAEAAGAMARAARIAPAPKAPEPPQPKAPVQAGKKAAPERGAPASDAPSGAKKPKRRKKSDHAPLMGWSAEADGILLTSHGAGEELDAVADRLGVPVAAAEVRLAVLRAEGADLGLIHAVLAALAPPMPAAVATVQKPAQLNLKLDHGLASPENLLALANLDFASWGGEEAPRPQSGQDGRQT